MATQITEWALARWEDRTTASFVPVNSHIDNRVIDAYGRLNGSVDYGWNIPRRPYKLESGSTSYVMYDSDAEGPVPIIRISEEEEAQHDLQ